MIKFKKSKLLYLGIFLFSGLLFFNNSSRAFNSLTDRIVVSWPSTGTSHEIKFRLDKAIPPSGKIILTPEAGEFFIPLGFNFNDIDIATSSTENGVYIERDLDLFPFANFDGVLTVANSFNGKITFSLSALNGIPEDSFVRIRFGDNAVHQAVGTRNIINPDSIGAYKINLETRDNGGETLEEFNLMIATAQPVTMTTELNKKYFSGNPSGWLTFGTTHTIVSLLTNYSGNCRYSTASNTPYDLMTDSFEYVGGASSTYHTVIVDGLENGGEYEYFARCVDSSGAGEDSSHSCSYDASTTPYTTASGTPITEMSCLEYTIKFSVSPIDGAVGGVEDGDGGDGDGEDGTIDDGGSGGGTGGGSGAGGGGGGAGGGAGTSIGAGSTSLLPYPPFPDSPGVQFLGWAYPHSTVSVIRDGQEEGSIKANVSAEFSAFLPDLEQGVYTFGLWSTDANGVRSITYSTTFWLDDGTQSTVSDIVIPPTISVANKTVELGQMLDFQGQTAPQSKVEIQIFPKKTGILLDAEIEKREVISDDNGNWTFLINSNVIESGDFRVKARANVKEKGFSEFSQLLEFTVGESTGEVSACEGADLNQDGKVNITDFSILLYHWGSDNECADQNKNGTVDLIDFSIMMYYWTG